MCWKLLNDVSGEIVCRSTIWSVIEPSTANLQDNHLEPLKDPVKPTKLDKPNKKIDSTGNKETLDEFMSLADIETPFSRSSEKGPVDSIPASTKSQTWQDIERGDEHYEDTQQQYFQSSQPKVMLDSTNTPLDLNQEKLM